MRCLDDVDFFYILEGHGWSTCYLYVEGALYVMGPTHIFENPIEVLLNGLIAILKGEHKIEFKWHDEPGEYHWSIQRNPEQHHKIEVSITNCSRLQNDENESHFETLCFEVKLKLFCICVLRQMEKIRDLITEKSFKQNRQNQFPDVVFEEFETEFKQVYNVMRG